MFCCFYLSCGRLLISDSSAFLRLRIYTIDNTATTITMTNTKHTTITVIVKEDTLTTGWEPALKIKQGH